MTAVEVLAHPGYRIVADDDPDAQRLVAVDDNDVQVCGAYRPHRLNDWMLYCTKTVADTVGMPQPQKVHVVSRADAIRWLDLIAALYRDRCLLRRQRDQLRRELNEYETGRPDVDGGAA